MLRGISASKGRQCSGIEHVGHGKSRPEKNADGREEPQRRGQSFSTRLARRAHDAGGSLHVGLLGRSKHRGERSGEHAERVGDSFGQRARPSNGPLLVLTFDGNAPRCVRSDGQCGSSSRTFHDDSVRRVGDSEGRAKVSPCCDRALVDLDEAIAGLHPSFFRRTWSDRHRGRCQRIAPDEVRNDESAHHEHEGRQNPGGPDRELLCEARGWPLDVEKPKRTDSHHLGRPRRSRDCDENKTRHEGEQSNHSEKDKHVVLPHLAGARFIFVFYQRVGFCATSTKKRSAPL